VYFLSVVSSLGCELFLPGLSRETGLFIFAIPRIVAIARIPKLSVFLLKGFIVFETGAYVMLPSVSLACGRVLDNIEYHLYISKQNIPERIVAIGVFSGKWLSIKQGWYSGKFILMVPFVGLKVNYQLTMTACRRKPCAEWCLSRGLC
jgi:hypothetical protein